MAVYAICAECGTRRDKTEKAGSVECVDKSGHRRAVRWVSSVKLSRTGKQLYKTWDSKERADIQERQWYTDHERGTLGIKAREKMLFAALVEKYKYEHVIPHNRHPETSTFSRLNLLVEGLGKHPVDEITLQQLKDLRTAWTAARDWEPATANKVFRIIHAIFEKAREWGIIEKNPAEFLGGLSEREPIPRFLTAAEIELLRRASPSQRLQDYELVLLHTGARPSSIEACSWDNGDVDFESRTIWFTTFKGAQGKMHRYPHPIDDQLMELLVRRAAETEKTGPVFDVSNIRYLAEQAIIDSKINIGKPEDRHFTIYGLKHCYASHLLMSGASMEEVRRLLGHTDTKMLQKHYSHLTQEYLRAVQSKVNLTPELKPRLQVI